MTNNNNSTGDNIIDGNFICEFTKLKQHYQNLTDSITKELEFYKTEYTVLKAEIHAIACQKEFERSCSNDPLDDYTKYKKITETVIRNLNQQIQQLLQEKKALHSLWNTSLKTASILELEIKEKNEIIKHPRISNKLKQLETFRTNFETTTDNMKMELERERRINVNLMNNLKNTEDKLKALEQKYNDILLEKTKYINHIKFIEHQLHSLKSNNSELQNAKSELEKRLSESIDNVRESVKRETDALVKIQELLNIADLAIADKNATLLREKDIREDCDHLASSIAEVFQEAANKVESDRKETEKRYIDDVQRLEGVINKIKVSQTQVLSDYSIVHQKNQMLETKLKEFQQINSKLDSELQMASLQIVDLELKLRAVEQVVSNEKEANKMYEQRTQEFREFMESKKRLNERWKNTIIELNERFDNEMKRLHGHIVQLQSSNEKLKSQLLNVVVSSSNE